MRRSRGNSNTNSQAYSRAFPLRRGKRVVQKQPSYEIIENTPHSELQFYDIYLSSLHTNNDSHDISDNTQNPPYTQAISLKRRRSRKVQQMARSKSRDFYADIVIVFKYKYNTTKDPSAKLELEQQTLKAYDDVLKKLKSVGLLYETRPSGRETVLVFVLCPWTVLKREVVRNSIHDWLKGVKVADTIEAEQLLKPAKQRDHSLDDLSDADRIRLIHDLITEMPSEGGAGIFPNEDGFVESLLPLHDWEFNKTWLRSWSTKWVVNQKDLSRVRNHFGEKVAYYFEFLEFYFLWLIIPTALGILDYFFGSSYSVFYSLSVILWAIIFIESWKRRERELALGWGVENVRKSEARRQDFQGDSMVIDPITDERIPFFSPWKRWARKIAGLPVILAGAFALSVLVTLMFGVEVFLEVYYGGHMKEVLVYLPTVLFTLAMPYVEETCNKIAKILTDFENHETNGSYDYHLVQKVFIFKVLNSYLSILLTAYVYIPFGPQLIAVLQTYGLPFATVAIEPRMLQDRLQAFMISNQLISFFSETIYPWLSRKLMTGAVKIQKEVSEVLKHEEHSEEEEGEFGAQDPEEVKTFLKNVQSQTELPVYDVNEDYCEMVEQFGFITMFSVIWPLTGLCAFINNWIELRSDAAKICFHTRRPLPARTDTIGPWMDNLEHLTWFSSLTNASILYLFKGAMAYHHQQSDDTPASSSDSMHSDVGSRLSLSMLLICLFASEHVYLGLRWIVKTVLEGIPTPAEVSVRRKDYGVKRSWLTRLNDAIGTTLEAVVGVNPDAFATSKNKNITSSSVAAATVLGNDDDENEREDTQGRVNGCAGENLCGFASVNGSLENDLGAQAIRSMFKSG